jgi:hypothetical protein
VLADNARRIQTVEFAIPPYVNPVSIGREPRVVMQRLELAADCRPAACGIG